MVKFLCPRGESLEDASSIRTKEGGLYKLKGHSEVDLIHDTTSPCELWHRRLAHISCKSLPDLSKVATSLPYLKIDNEGVCKGCVKGKNIKNPFPKKRHQDIRNIGTCSLRCMWSNALNILKWVCVLCNIH